MKRVQDAREQLQKASTIAENVRKQSQAGGGEGKVTLTITCGPGIFGPVRRERELCKGGQYGESRD